MKRLKWAGLAFLVTCIIFSVTVFAGIDYNTENDPLVTLSYLEKVKTQIINDLTEKFGNKEEPKLPEVNSGYEIISLTAGQTITATDSSEIILRSGDAIVLVTGSANIENKIGLSDVTAGTELLVGTEIPKNHYIVIPRGDGRGAQITSSVAYFMVRGEYEIGAAK